jgi:hypothetical protein
MWAAIGCVLSLGLAAAAWWRSRAHAGPFDGAVYGMTRRSHQRYALAGLVLAAAFAMAFAWSAMPVIPLLAIAIVVIIFYAASFVRGAESDE